MKLIFPLAAFVAISGWVGSSARAGDPWYQEFEEGQAAARREGKDLLIDFGGSDWCEPCQLLKMRIFSRPEFIVRAREAFVLVDIDLPLRTPIAADRKDRYERLQERYAIESFPSVILATADGRPYAQTTYLTKINDPASYWDYLQTLRRRGERLKAAWARADRLQGRARAEAIADGLAEVYPGLVPLFYADRVKELRELDPSDITGYLAFLDGRKAVDALKLELNRHDGKAAVGAGSADAVIARSKLRGESLQEALVLRALVQAIADRPSEALDSFAAVLDAQRGRTRFDRGDYVPLDAASIEVVRKRIAKGKADPKDRLAAYYALHRIFWFELPDPYQLCCGGRFRIGLRSLVPISDLYGTALIESTAGLSSEARALALGKGLEGTFFPCQGPIRTIVLQLIPGLVGKDAAKDYLPGDEYFPGSPYYKSWLAD
jgi:thiol-disulfide isomerase/thioredoxin